MKRPLIATSRNNISSLSALDAAADVAPVPDAGFALEAAPEVAAALELEAPSETGVGAIEEAEAPAGSVAAPDTAKLSVRAIEGETVLVARARCGAMAITSKIISAQLSHLVTVPPGLWRRSKADLLFDLTGI
jgi:hypothetical protein